MKHSLQFIFSPCLSHHSHPVHLDQTKELVCRSLGSRSTQVQEVSTLVPLLFGSTSRCLSVQPFRLLPSRNIWRHISSTWTFPHRHQHARWPVDVSELFHRFYCWAPIWLSRYWVWLGYWRYRNLIDWFIARLIMTVGPAVARCMYFGPFVPQTPAHSMARWCYVTASLIVL